MCLLLYRQEQSYLRQQAVVLQELLTKERERHPHSVHVTHNNNNNVDGQTNSHCEHSNGSGVPPIDANKKLLKTLQALKDRESEVTSRKKG